MKLKTLGKMVEPFGVTEKMPVLFVGHGSPMNAIEDNRFTQQMKSFGTSLERPNAILMISAHWQTKGTFVTAQDMPPTVRDFGGFPKVLFEVQYPVPGLQWLEDQTRAPIQSTQVEASEKWGHDHGAWSVLNNMYPEADVPVIQLNRDYSRDAQYHYDLAKQLAGLRTKGVLIMGSGNMVHNLGKMSLKGKDFNETYGCDWAIEANELLKR